MDYTSEDRWFSWHSAGLLIRGSLVQFAQRWTTFPVIAGLVGTAVDYTSEDRWFSWHSAGLQIRGSLVQLAECWTIYQIIAG
ncbi:hypothetical protein DPMN_014505 [Dreissena polymorpha]|uniref:Uncharacterized protein n=1 Tax=Dreissena polymorpha TaxID=45954 RepID=A0A9D4NAW7_DREPO|nr:hypothetical protein DPMN_014505 [Dreissena polymorpha]